MKRDLERLLWVVMAAAALLSIGNAVLGIRNIGYVYRASDDAQRSRQVLRSLDLLISTAKDAETGQRGFVITGDSSYLSPFLSASSTIGERLVAIDSLTRSEPSQLDRTARLRALITAKLEELRQTVSLRAEVGFAAAEAVVRTGRGKATMDSLRLVVDSMINEEDSLLRDRMAIVAAARNRTIVIILLEAILELATLAGLAVLIRRYLRSRERARRELFGQKETFRTTLASIGDGVLTTDADGNVTYLNPVAEELTGWSTADAAGIPLDTVFDIVNESTRARVMNPAVRALKDGIIVGLANHTVLIARGGREVPIDDSAAPIRSADGAITGAVLVFRDISERKSAELALRQADHRKDEFLAILAHELRNPLAPLRNALEILRLSHHDVATVEHTAGIMERQLQQMVRLIDDLLDVSRITRNRLDLMPATIDIASVVHAAIETCGPTLRASGHELQLTLPAVPLYVHADRARLAQAVGNLLSNAIKYTERGGTIGLIVTTDSDQVSVTVRDSGVGIPADMLSVIFDMFVQVDRSLERTQGGLGIGLPLVQRIVEMHHGTITAKSAGPGKGSEFTIRLKRVPAPDTPRTEHSMPQDVPRRRILIADDNHDAAGSLATMLRIMGHDVLVTYDGEQVVVAGATFDADVILLDIGMPKLNGYEAARRIRATDWGRTVTLVAVTGWGQESDRQESEAAGFDLHIVKPIDAETLGKVLRRSVN